MIMHTFSNKHAQAQQNNKCQIKLESRRCSIYLSYCILLYSLRDIAKWLVDTTHDQTWLACSLVKEKALLARGIAVKL